MKTSVLVLAEMETAVLVLVESYHLHNLPALL